MQALDVSSVLYAAGAGVGENTAVKNGERAFASNTGVVPPPYRHTVIPPMVARGRGRTNRVRFSELKVRSLTNPPKSTGMAFWSINPYVGCALNCTYCYAHYTHRYVAERVHDANRISRDEFTQLFEPSSEPAFARHIFVKQRDAVLNALERDIVRIHKQNPPENAATLAIGTATDPYQPAERQFGITRAILETFLATEGLELGITTKSPLICRDIDLLLQLGRRHRLTVYISLICNSERLIRLFEQHSPSPQARLRALSSLREAGIVAGVNAAPVLPGITDSVFEIEGLMAAAKEAGTSFVYPSVLRIYPSVRKALLPVIEQHFPNLMPRYRAAYKGDLNAPSNYETAMRRRFKRLACKHGIDLTDPFRREVRPQVEPEAQLRLL